MRDPFAGIIFETAALVLLRLNAFLRTKDPAVFQICTIQTIAAGTLYLFSKQHGYASGSFLPPLYRKRPGISTSFLYFPENNHQSRNPDCDEQALLCKDGAA